MGLGYRITYRAWQFWQIIVAGPLSPETVASIKTVLNAEQTQLFLRQSPAGQQHGYRVMRSLLNEGHQDQELLAAALLHDAGKIRITSRWWDRPVVVLIQALFPGKVEQWGKGDGSGWRRPFVIKKRHPDWGADYAKTVSCSPLTVELIRRHQDPVNDGLGNRASEWLSLLQWSDNRN